MRKEAQFWKKNERVHCFLCPHECVISEKKRGICGVRENSGGMLYSLIYASCSSAYPDPIEKKPLFHFYPGTRAFSLGTVGCNFRCLHCQNYTISQVKPEEYHLMEILPEEAVEQAKKTECEGIAFTYNEPTIWWEYTYETAKVAKKEGLYTSYVTNGFINEDAINEIAPYLDGANVDVKAMNEEFYKKICKARLQPVLNACKVYKEKGVHVEVTYLVIPNKNDGEGEIKKFCQWVIHELGEHTPTHFSAFYPHHKMRDMPPTSFETLLKIYGIAKKKGILYPYLGNVPHGEYENTMCPVCNNKIIERRGFSARVVGLEGAKCNKCGEKIPIVV